MKKLVIAITAVMMFIASIGYAQAGSTLRTKYEMIMFCATLQFINARELEEAKIQFTEIIIDYDAKNILLLSYAEAIKNKNKLKITDKEKNDILKKSIRFINSNHFKISYRKCFIYFAENEPYFAQWFDR